MFRTLRAAVLALAAIGGTAASADHYMQTADPQVVQGLSTIIALYEQQCMMGNPQGCQGVTLAQQEAHTLLLAGYDCRAGVQGACPFYQNGVQVLGNVLAQIQAAQVPVDPYQRHSERMDDIRRWGESRLAIGDQNMALMQQRHESFLNNVIRN